MTSHKQLKVSVESDLAESFKAACMHAGVSMAAELSTFMAARVGTLAEFSAKLAKQDSYDTRAKRRHHVCQIIIQLEVIMGCEGAYMSRIPVNLQSGEAYENAEMAIDTLEQAIDLLKDAF